MGKTATSMCSLARVLIAGFQVCSGLGLSGRVRAVSLDVTGTLITHGEPVMKSYADAAVWARLPDPPSESELKPAFKAAYKEALLEYPCFGGRDGLNGREWWRKVIRRVLDNVGRGYYSDAEFERYFRRVYQHFGSPRGYARLADADDFLAWAADESNLLLGITSNTPARHMESVLPMLGLHDNFRWFACAQDVGFEKPAPEMFEAALEQARFWIPDLEPHEVLHIGDSLACDLCGAKAFGFQAVLLDRSNEPRVTAYQDWVVGPDYPGKSEADILSSSVTDMRAVVQLLQSQNA